MNFSKAFNPNDIRGIYGKEISDELVYRIGKAFITYFKLKKIVVGRDMRISSPTLFNSFVKGASEQGADVFDIGMISSDALYFATGYFNIPGAMITASHNPARYNGIKFSLEKAIPINGKEELKKIRNLAEKNNFQKLKMGRVIKKNIAPHYVKHVQSFIKKEKLRKMKVVVDAGNGMAGKMIPIVCKNLPIKIVPIEFFLDGNFPRHDANPSDKKNTKYSELKVCMTNSDFGVAFDGDMDRVVFIDDKCSRVDSSLITCLIIKELLNKKRHGVFVYNSVMSKIISETAKKYGGKAYMEKVGHVFIKRRMRKLKAEFGAENSGHFYYKKNYFADSGIITFLIITEIYSKFKGRFSEMLNEFSKYSKTEEISFKVKNKEEIIKKIERHYNIKAKKISHFDGTTMDFGEWWFNLRKSNTEPLIRLNLEANSKILMNKKRKELTSMIKKLS